MDISTEAKREEVKPHKKFEVAVIYNGMVKEVDIRPDETVKQVLERATNAFAPLPQPHLLGLYNTSGAELNDADSVQQAGIRAGDQLLLRPSQVKGG